MLVNEVASSLLVPNKPDAMTTDAIARRFPQSQPLLDHWKTPCPEQLPPRCTWGALRSVFTEFIWFMRDNMAQHARFAEEAGRIMDKWTEDWRHINGSDWKFELNIVEDKVTLADAPSHARGLVPFCRFNPRAHVRRTVNIWTFAITHEFDNIPLFQALKELQDGNCTSWIYCNFNTGTVPDVQSLLQDQFTEWNQVQEQPFETVALLPPFLDLHPYSIAYW
ncbi:hypothetical protein BU23DRAFT_568547 [Bimuria novae-zelandiae CBS 107.79]|uniref:Uncharacterized protein n=1 Tax=Bimuria novae-zelandiae CBS 107.79 TaxID=1447943 RepID=A0A6A5VB88_9PLEO|nr:hypothetical protein BU23DRAFT_568547 [Bimuria novae-zelandiae CBS 107.79]